MNCTRRDIMSESFELLSFSSQAKHPDRRGSDQRSGKGLHVTKARGLEI